MRVYASVRPLGWAFYPIRGNWVKMALNHSRGKDPRLQITDWNSRSNVSRGKGWSLRSLSPIEDKMGHWELRFDIYLQRPIVDTFAGILVHQRKRESLFNGCRKKTVCWYLCRSITETGSWDPTVTAKDFQHGAVFNFDFAKDGSLLVAACERKSLLLFDPLSHKHIQVSSTNPLGPCLSERPLQFYPFRKKWTGRD